MTDPTRELSKRHDIAAKVAQVFQARAKLAQERFNERVQKAYEQHVAGLTAKPMSPWEIWASGAQYAVDFAQRSVLNRFKRADEKPFETVNAISDFNQRAYELFARPMVQALSNDYGAKLSREFHPLRFQRWAVSDLNPWLWWLAPTAQAVKAQRQRVQPIQRSADQTAMLARIRGVLGSGGGRKPRVVAAR